MMEGGSEEEGGKEGKSRAHPFTFVRSFVQTGLSLRVRLLRSLPERYKVDIKVKAGTHQSENAGTSSLSFSLRLPHRAQPSSSSQAHLSFPFPSPFEQSTSN